MVRNLISVVDDESVRRSTRLLVESFAFRAAAFETAEGFLKSGQVHDNSCLLLDMQLLWNSCSSLKGLPRKATAPACMARLRDSWSS